MSFTANSLKRGILRNPEVIAIATEIINDLNAEVIAAHDMGLLFIDTTITNVFSISNMKLCDARREIYYMILVEFIRRRFRILMKQQKDNTRVVIAWFSKKDLLHINKQVALIQYCGKEFKERTNKDNRIIDTIVRGSTKKPGLIANKKRLNNDANEQSEQSEDSDQSEQSEQSN
jgi:hypothetical protein